MNAKIILGLLLLPVLVGCNTYYMTTESLQQQLSTIDTAIARKVPDAIPLLVSVSSPDISQAKGLVIPTGGEHWNNGLEKVYCTDKGGNKWMFSVNYSTQVRLTQKSGKRRIIYFDTMIMKDSVVYASESHMIHVSLKPVPINDISKIELQFRNSTKSRIQ